MESLLFATGLTSFVLGGAMTVFASRVVRQNRRREAARVQLLSALAFPDGMPDDRSGPDVAFHFDELEADEFRRDQPLAASSLFVEPEKSEASSRRALVLAALFLVMTAIVGAYRWFGGTTAASSESAVSATAVATSPVTSPDPRVELLVLEHRSTPAALLVTGRIRNTIHAAPLHDVVAMVHIVDRTGRILTTVRVPVTDAVLDAGESADFSAAVANAPNGDRYRVEFHAREGESIPQIDRRQTESGSRSE